MSSPEAAGPAASTPPDWSTLTLELHCPRCGYNLRMLTSSRCPECGLEFEWSEVIAASQDLITSPLFEHQWRKRPVRSFIYTVRRTIRPRTLWSELPLALPVRTAPLVAVVLTLLVMYILVLAAANFLVDLHWRLKWSTTSASFWRRGIPWSLEASLNALAACGPITIVLPLAWVFVQVFRRTLTRWRVKQAQVLRVLVLAWVPMVLLKMAWAAVAALWYGIHGSTQYWIDVVFLGAGDAASVLLLTYSMALGLTLYLKLRHGSLAALAVIWLSLQSWATVDILYSVVVGTWNNNVAWLTYLAWPGITNLVGWLLGF